MLLWCFMLWYRFTFTIIFDSKPCQFEQKELTCSYFRLKSLSKKLIVSYFCYVTEHDQSLFYNSLKRQCNGSCNKLFNYEGLPGVLEKEGYLKITFREQGNSWVIMGTWEHRFPELYKKSRNKKQTCSKLKKRLKLQ